MNRRATMLAAVIAGLCFSVPSLDGAIKFKICPDGDCITKSTLVEADGVIDPLVGTPTTFDALNFSLYTDDFLTPISVDLHAPFSDAAGLEFFGANLEDIGFGAQVIFSNPINLDVEMPILDIVYAVNGTLDFGFVVDMQWLNGLGGGIDNGAFLAGAGIPIELEQGFMLVELSEFRRGDANNDGVVNLADAIWELNFLFQSGPASTCESAADANDDGQLNIGDPTYILNYLFADGPAPPAPFNSCGFDPTPDFLECEGACF